MEVMDIITYETDRRIWFIDHENKLMTLSTTINKSKDIAKSAYKLFIVDPNPFNNPALNKRKVLVKYE